MSMSTQQNMRPNIALNPNIQPSIPRPFPNTKNNKSLDNIRKNPLPIKKLQNRYKPYKQKPTDPKQSPKYHEKKLMPLNPFGFNPENIIAKADTPVEIGNADTPVEIGQADTPIEVG